MPIKVLLHVYIEMSLGSFFVHELIEYHYSDIIMSMIASQITSLTIFYSTVHSGGDQRKHQSSASLAFVRGIHRGLVNSPHKGPVRRKMFPFDDFIMIRCYNNAVQYSLILYTVLLCLRQNQGSICVCAQPMRDNVTLQHHLSLAGCIHKIIPENINFNLNSLKHAILHLYRELWGVFMMILEKIDQEITRLYCIE